MLYSCDNTGNSSSDGVSEKSEISLTEAEFIKWHGRTEVNADGSVSFDYTASGFEVKFRGTALEMQFKSTESSSDVQRVYLTVITDGENYRTAPYYALDSENKTLTVEVEDGVHTVKVLKRSEASQSRVALTGLSVEGVFLKTDAPKERFIEFYGDSVTCGYGNVDSVQTDPFSTRTEDGLATYAYIAAQKLNADCSILSGSGMAINMNIWGNELKIPHLLGRKSYYNSSAYTADRIPQVVVINGGANDNTYIQQVSGSEREARVDAFIAAYAAFINEIRAAYPGVKIICCTNMMGDGGLMEYRIMRAMEEAVYDIDLAVLSLPALNGEDGIGASGHPGYKTHEKAADVLVNKINEEMGW